MSFIERLNKLIKTKRINKKILSEESGIPYSTIQSWYNSGYERITISTLIILSNYFNCSVDYLIGKDVVPIYNLTEEDIEFMNLYKQTSAWQRHIIDDILKGEK
jgi:transcriptional regulator with XRE-family HTH domain